MAFGVVYYKKIGTWPHSGIAFQGHPLEDAKSAIPHLLSQKFAFCRNVLKLKKPTD